MKNFNKLLITLCLAATMFVFVSCGGATPKSPNETMAEKIELSTATIGEIDFEGCTFKAPGHPDEYLQSIYGDWRKLPPPEKRVVHSLFFVPNLIEPKELLPKSKSADK